jgi:hypothetical protein
MADPLTIFPTFLKYASKVWALPLRFYYTKERLDPYLKFDVSASGEPINYNYHSQDAYCYIEVYNLSPFNYTIDRIKVDVGLDAGGSFSCTNTTPYLIKGASHERIYIRSPCPMTADSAQRSKENIHARITIDAYILTSFCSFRIGRYIDQVKNVRVIA